MLSLRLPAHRRVPAILLAALLAGGCGATRPAAPAVLPAATAPASADELYELSPARVQVRRLALQALRLLAPHWSAIRKSDRRVLQATLVETVSEERVAPFVKARLRKAVAESPALAAETVEWLRSPVGYAVKFAEATAMRGDRSPESTFYQQIAEVREDRTPAIRIGRIRALADATGALERTLDLTGAVGTVAARLVNVARPNVDPLPLAELRRRIQAERRVPAVTRAYEPVVTAALLLRSRDLGLDELDGYVAFASTDAGRWYHETLAAALVAAVGDAAMDVEGVFDANAHSDRPAEVSGGFDLDALVVTLPSGRDVRLLNMAQVGPPAAAAVVLRYESSLPIADAGPVGREAREVWDHVRTHIENGGARAAVLQSTGSVDGWVFPFASSRRYGWNRADSGAWSPTVSEDGALKREVLWSLPP